MFYNLIHSQWQNVFTFINADRKSLEQQVLFAKSKQNKKEKAFLGKVVETCFDFRLSLKLVSVDTLDLNDIDGREANLQVINSV